MASKSRIAAQAEAVKLHPQLLDILSAVLQGKPLREIAEAFALPEKELVAYCREAGLVPGSAPAPGPERKESPDPEASLEREQPALGPEKAPRQPVSTSVHERQVLEEGSRRRGDPQGQRDPAEKFCEERDASFKELLRASRAEDQAYREQPMPAIGARLREDPLGQAGFELHVGFQPPSRLLALAMRDRARREARRAEWFSDPFNWRQEPPPGWFDQ